MQGVRRHVVDHKLGILVMVTSLVLLAASLVFLSTRPHEPEPQAVAGPGFRYFALMDGSCQEVRLGSVEQNSRCGHALVHTLSVAGRASFSLILTNTHAVSFSGTSDTQIAPDQYQLLVDSVTLIDEKKNAHRLDAQGQCIVSGDINHSATVVCDATTQQPVDSYHFSFTSTKPAEVVYGR